MKKRIGWFPFSLRRQKFTFRSRTHLFPSEVGQDAVAILNHWSYIKEQYEKKYPNSETIFPTSPPYLTKISYSRKVGVEPGKQLVTIEIPRIGVQSPFTYGFTLDDHRPIIQAKHLERSIVIGPPEKEITRGLVFPEETSNKPESFALYAIPHDEINKKNYLCNKEQIIRNAKRRLTGTKNCILIGHYSPENKTWNALEKPTLSNVLYQRQLFDHDLHNTLEVKLGISEKTVKRSMNHRPTETLSTLMLDLGTALRTYVATKKPYSRKMIEIAQGYCKQVQDIHNKGFLINDINLGNVVYDPEKKGIDAVSIIDPEAIANKDKHVKKCTPDFSHFIDDDCLEPEPSSIARDLYGVGKVFQILYEKNPRKTKNEHLHFLGSLMATEDPDRRLPIEKALFWLELADQCEPLVNAMANYVSNNKDSINKANAENEVRQLLDFLFDKIKNQKEEVDIFQLEALACLFHLPASIPAKENFLSCAQKIFTTEPGSTLSCILTGIRRHVITSKKDIHDATNLAYNALQQNTAKELENLFTSNTSSKPGLKKRLENLFTRNISSEPRLKKQIEKFYTTSTIPSPKFESIAHKKLFAKLRTYPEYKAIAEKMYQFSPTVASIIFTSFQYLEEHKGKLTRKMGRRAVRNLIDKLSSNQSLDVNEALKNCCNHGALLFKSSEKEGSRADAFKKFMTPTLTRT